MGKLTEDDFQKLADIANSLRIPQDPLEQLVADSKTGFVSIPGSLLMEYVRQSGVRVDITSQRFLMGNDATYKAGKLGVSEQVFAVLQQRNELSFNESIQNLTVTLY